MEESFNPPDEPNDPRLDETPPGASPGGCPRQPERDYEVGYGKPPKEYQFKKGQSGNRKNRPRRAKTQGRLLSEVLDEKVSITEDGHRRKIPKTEAMLKQVVNRAAQGDKKSTQAVLRMIEGFYRHCPKPGTKAASVVSDPAVHLLLSDNGFGLPEDPELIQRLIRTTRDWEIERQRKKNPGNDNYDDSVWKLQKP
jgi:hypothetical protein